jgi:hypothetical protein
MLAPVSLRFDIIADSPVHEPQRLPAGPGFGYERIEGKVRSRVEVP